MHFFRSAAHCAFIFERKFTGENTTLNPCYNSPHLGFLYFIRKQKKIQTDAMLPHGLAYEDTESLRPSPVSLSPQESCCS